MPVKLFANVGVDSFSEQALKHLAKESIDTSLISIVKNIFTGIASFFSIDGDNLIVVMPGANMLLEVTEEFKKYVNN